MDDFINRLKDKVKSSMDNVAGDPTNIAAVPIDDHHGYAQKLAAEHAQHHEIYHGEDNKKTLAAQLAVQFLDRAEAELHDLAHATQHEGALNVIAGTKAPAALVAQGKLGFGIQPTPVQDAPGAVREGAEPEGAIPLLDKKRSKELRNRLKAKNSPAQREYDAEISAKKERGKAFSSLIKQPTGDGDGPLERVADSENSGKMKRFSNLFGRK